MADDGHFYNDLPAIGSDGQPVEPRSNGRASRAPALPKPWSSKFGFMPFTDLDAPGEEFEYIVDDMFSVGSKAMILGKMGSGKSFLSTHLAFCIALGRSFFGFDVVRPGLVIIQSGEGAAGMKKRFRGYRAHYGVPDETMIPLGLLRGKINLFRQGADAAKMLIEELRGIAEYYKTGVAMFIIDTWSNATLGADEIGGKDMGVVLENIGLIQDAIKCSVLVVHHPNSAGTGPRGHSSVPNNFDEIIEVERDMETNIRTVTIRKLKDGEDGKKFRFELPSIETGRMERTGKPERSCVCVAVGEKEEIAKRDAARGAPIKEREEPIFRAVMAARKDVGVMADADAIAKGVPSGTVVITSVQFRDALTAQRIDLDEVPPGEDAKAVLKRANDAARKIWERNAGGLLKYGILGFASPYIWWSGKPVRGYPETMDATRTSARTGSYEPDVDFGS